jgi:hypothetical protein
MVRQLCVVLAVAAVSVGCDDDPPGVTPTPTPPQRVTETFGGTIERNDAEMHLFISGGLGEVVATLTSIAPDNTVTMGLSLGIWNGNQCAIVVAKDSTPQGGGVLGQSNAPGQLCLRVYDVGSLVEPASYEVTVVHP